MLIYIVSTLCACVQYFRERKKKKKKKNNNKKTIVICFICEDLHVDQTNICFTTVEAEGEGGDLVMLA